VFLLGGVGKPVERFGDLGGSEERTGVIVNDDTGTDDSFVVRPSMTSVMWQPSRAPGYSG